MRGARRRIAAAGVAAVVVLVYAVVRLGPWRDGWEYGGVETLDLVSGGGLVCGTGWEEPEPRDPSEPLGRLGDIRSRLFCLDASTGEEAFHQPIDDGLRDLWVVGQTVLLGGDTRLEAYSVDDGASLWTARAELVGPGAAEAGGVLLATTPGRELTGIDLTTGDERWRTSDGESAGLDLSPVSDGERFYASRWATDGPEVVALDPESGEKLWQSPIGGIRHDIGAAAPVDGGRAVALLVENIADGLGRVVVLDTATGERRWEVRVPADADLAQVGETLVVTYLREVHGFDREGHELWSTDVRHMPYQQPLHARSADLLVEGGALYLVGEIRQGGRRVVQIDPSSGHETEVADDVLAPVRIAGGHLVVPDSDHVEGRPLDG